MTNNDTNVVSREVLHKGAIVSVKLPKHLSPGSVVIEDGEDIQYLQYPINVPGGMVNVFVRSGDKSLAGRTVYAEVEIALKTMKSGRKFTYIDLYLVEGYAQVTHRLVVLDSSFSKQDHWQVFETPGMNGFVALIGPDEKIIQPSSESARSDSATKSTLPARIERVVLPKEARPKPAKLSHTKTDKPTTVLRSFAELGAVLGSK